MAHDWYRQTALRLVRDCSTDLVQEHAALDAVDTALRESASRARAEEREHGLQALRMAHEMQETAVAAERERCAKIADEQTDEPVSSIPSNVSAYIAARIRATALAAPEEENDV